MSNTALVVYFIGVYASGFSSGWIYNSAHRARRTRKRLEKFNREYDYDGYGMIEKNS